MEAFSKRNVFARIKLSIEIFTEKIKQSIKWEEEFEYQESSKLIRLSGIIFTVSKLWTKTVSQKFLKWCLLYGKGKKVLIFQLIFLPVQPYSFWLTTWLVGSSLWSPREKESEDREDSKLEAYLWKLFRWSEITTMAEKIFLKRILLRKCEAFDWDLEGRIQNNS